MSNLNVWSSIEIVTSMLEVFISYMFLRDFLGQKNNSKLMKFSAFAGFFIALVLLNKFFPIPNITLVFVMVSIFLLSFVFNGDVKVKIFATILLVAFMIVSEMLTLFGTMAFVKIDTNIAGEGMPLLFGIIISKTIFLIITRVVCFFKQKKYGRMPIKYWVPLLTVPLFSTLTLYVIFEYNQLGGYSAITLPSLISAIGILAFNVIIFYLFDEMLEKSSVEMRNKLLQQQIDFQIQHFNDLEISQKETRRVRHDMKNHLLCLKDFIMSNKTEDAAHYIESITDVVSKSNTEISTGNPVIDSLLNAKIMQAENDNIAVEKIIEIPSDVKIAPVDACVIFGNALDNAIEACNRIENGDKKIKIVLAYLNNKLIFKITNTTDGNLKKTGKYFITSKANNKNHGLGLENIDNIISKYNGTLNFEHKDNEFELSLMI